MTLYVVDCYCLKEMADISGTRTSGLPAWDYYIKNNPDWKKLELRIENKKSTYIFQIKNKGLIPGKKLYKAKTKLQLLDNKIKKVGRISMANVQIGDEKGFISIATIRKPSKAGERGTTFDEKVAFKDLKKLIKKFKTPMVPISLGVKKEGKVMFTIHDAIDVQTFKGNPKADFAIVSKSNKMPLFISHKKAGGPKAFQQFSGVSLKAGLRISEHKEVKSFLRKLVSFMDIEKKRLIKPVFSIIKDPKLKNLAVFGSEYKKGSKDFSEEYVQIIGQGNPILTSGKKKSSFTLEWSEHFAPAGEIKSFKGDLEIVFLATFRAGRKFHIDGKTYTGARIMIAPLALAKGRSDLTEI